MSTKKLITIIAGMVIAVAMHAQSTSAWKQYVVASCNLREAKVMIDGKEVPLRGDGRFVTKLGLGEHHLVAKHVGFVDYETTFTFTEDSPRKEIDIDSFVCYPVRFVNSNATTLRVQSVKLAGDTTNYEWSIAGTEVMLPPGRNAFEFEIAGYDKQSMVIEVKKLFKQTIEIPLLNARWAYVDIDLVDVNCDRVFIDGEAFDIPTVVKLMPGEHIISLFNDNTKYAFSVSEHEHIEIHEIRSLRLADDTISFTLVEKKPLFKGKDTNEFTRWVNSKLVYPEIAKENGVQGRVMLQFIVETDGSVTNVKVIHGVDDSLDREAVRVVSMSPKWTPGMMHGKPVRVTYTFPVIFQLR